MITRLVLLRHGETIWNKDNRFTGWTDVDLSDRGLSEAKEAGRLLRESGFVFDIAFTSILRRAIRTLWLVLDEMNLMWIPVEKSWRLNERHYGALQGLNKAKTARQYGEEQVLLWRRSYDVRPPSLKKTDKRYPGHDLHYKDLNKNEVPVTECLADVGKRFLPYWHGTIIPTMNSGKKVLIVAHGNSLRALVKHLDDVSDKEIVSLNIPTGIPLVYELDKGLKPIKHYYLGAPERGEELIESIENQRKSV